MGLIKTSHPPYEFTIQQYDGLLTAGLTATTISIAATAVSLTVHFLLLWYDHHRPVSDNQRMNDILRNNKNNTNQTQKELQQKSNATHSSNGRTSHTANTASGAAVTTTATTTTSSSSKTPREKKKKKRKHTPTGVMNRVSLRLIIFACSCYVIYSISELSVATIPDNILSCRVLSFFIVIFDVMGTMCLGLVGLNLVLVFVVNVKHPEYFEKYYYSITAVISLCVMIPPLVLRGGLPSENTDSCWYHFFFEGREISQFNWLYYYSWLLFASLLATVSCVIAILTLMRERNSFAHTINLLNREELSHSRPEFNDEMVVSRQLPQQRSYHYMKTHTEQHSAIYRSVAIRCIFYALVPVLCKSWGIAIEIAIVNDVTVSYPILVIDRFMSGITGFCVSCIYMSDPSVRIIWKDMMKDYRKRYVNLFYYMDTSQIIYVEGSSNIYSTSAMEESQARENRNTNDITNNECDYGNRRSIFTVINLEPGICCAYVPFSALRRPLVYKAHKKTSFSTFFQRLSHSRQYADKEDKVDDHDSHDPQQHQQQTTRWYTYLLSFITCHRRKTVKRRWIPVRRLDTTIRDPIEYVNEDGTCQNRLSLDSESGSVAPSGYNGSTIVFNANSKNRQNRIVEPYSYPLLAKFYHWIFVYVLLYSPPYYRRRQKQRYRKKSQPDQGSGVAHVNISHEEDRSQASTSSLGSDNDLDDYDDSIEDDIDDVDGVNDDDGNGNGDDGEHENASDRRGSNPTSRTPSCYGEGIDGNNVTLSGIRDPSHSSRSARASFSSGQQGNGAPIISTRPEKAIQGLWRTWLPSESPIANLEELENFEQLKQQKEASSQSKVAKSMRQNDDETPKLPTSQGAKHDPVSLSSPKQAGLYIGDTYKSTSMDEHGNEKRKPKDLQQGKPQNVASPNSPLSKHNEKKGKRGKTHIQITTTDGVKRPSYTREKLKEPTIGQLVRATSPTPSFMSVRRAAAAMVNPRPPSPSLHQYHYPQQRHHHNRPYHRRQHSNYQESHNSQDLEMSHQQGYSPREYDRHMMMIRKEGKQGLRSPDSEDVLSSEGSSRNTDLRSDHSHTLSTLSEYPRPLDKGRVDDDNPLNLVTETSSEATVASASLAAASTRKTETPLSKKCIQRYHHGPGPMKEVEVEEGEDVNDQCELTSMELFQQAVLSQQGLSPPSGKHYGVIFRQGKRQRP